MMVSISVVLLLTVIVGLLIRFAKLPVWQALVCLVWGFYLAKSTLSPTIGNTLGDIWSLF